MTINLRKISEFCITVGYACNFKCAHCGVSVKRGLSLSSPEITLLVDTIVKHNFGSLLFVGGEPTLYIGKINLILSGIGKSSKPRVVITTNGHFAGSKVSAIRTLSSFDRLNSVQLSYDKFHKKFLPAANIKHLYSACRELGMDFRVLLSIDSPLDLVLVKELQAVGTFNVAVQKVQPIGDAGKNGLMPNYPSFDADVLRKKCPNRTKLIYMCGEGFTTCCSYLAFQDDSAKYIHPTEKAHFTSPFYKLISKLTFSGLMKKIKVSSNEFLPEHSDPCGICRHIFQEAVRIGRV